MATSALAGPTSASSLLGGVLRLRGRSSCCSGVPGLRVGGEQDAPLALVVHGDDLSPRVPASCSSYLLLQAGEPDVVARLDRGPCCP